MVETVTGQSTRPSIDRWLRATASDRLQRVEGVLIEPSPPETSARETEWRRRTCGATSERNAQLRPEYWLYTHSATWQRAGRLLHDPSSAKYRNNSTIIIIPTGPRFTFMNIPNRSANSPEFTSEGRIETWNTMFATFVWNTDNVYQICCKTKLV